MTTTAPGLSTVKPSQGKPRRVSRDSHVSCWAQELGIDKIEPYYSYDDFIPSDDYAYEDDPTEYPDWEPMGREPVESDIANKLQAVLERYQASRGIVCYVGSDNFIYWLKGNNKRCVAPDLYILPGMPPDARPTHYVGSKDEGCWKTWIHNVVPNFAVEVKARRNPRKDELQSPQRHDALGTKELIVFDPFLHIRRKGRKRFVVYRRDTSRNWVIVEATNNDRVYSQELDAYLVAQGKGDDSLLRLGLGPKGERLVPFESELVDMHAQHAEQQAQRAEHEARLRLEEARRADDEARLRLEEARLRQEEARRADDEARLRQEEARRADDESQRANEEARRRQEESRRADEEARLRLEEARRADQAIRHAQQLEAELERLRAGSSKRRKR